MRTAVRMSPRAMGWACGLILCVGCTRHAATPPAATGVDQGHYQRLAKNVEFPEIDSQPNSSVAYTAAPVSLANETTPEYWDLSLEKAVQIALENSKIMRDMGGLVLRTPDSARTKGDPALAQTDPRFGIEAALAAFDARFQASASFEKNDRGLNNVFFGGGTRILDQDFHVYQTNLSKKSVTGTSYSLKNYTQYDANNAPGNAFGSAWTTWYDAEVRHPLLQGSGVNFNRLAGPNASPGLINGVVIARINADASLADFEIGVRNFVSDIENAYWDLYFAYRDLDAKVSARDAALETWRRVHALYQQGRRGGEAEKEAQAREQYYRYQEEAQNALQGRLVDGTRTNNGSTGGTFRGTGGIYVTERRLRLILGLPISDGRLIRPQEEPFKAKVAFNWDSGLNEALTRRVELRRQKWIIKKREAELEANQNFLKPQLDALARYRWRGFGHDLFPNGGTGQFNNAYTDLSSGKFQEWQLGFEFSLPIGFRQAYSAVRHAELQLARERAVLYEQERTVCYDLSNSIAEADRAYKLVETGLNRRIAAWEQLSAMQAAFEADNATVDMLLDAQRRMAEADAAYYRALVEYTLAVKNVQLEKGTLLEYNSIFLQEGPWPDQAYRDADERESRRYQPLLFPEPASPPPVSRGPFPQGPFPTEASQSRPTPPKAAEPLTAPLPTPSAKDADSNRE